MSDPYITLHMLFTLVEHVLKLGVLIVPSAYPEHLSAPEMGL